MALSARYTAAPQSRQLLMDQETRKRGLIGHALWSVHERTQFAASLGVCKYPATSYRRDTSSDDSADPLHRFLQDLIAKWPHKFVSRAVTQ